MIINEIETSDMFFEFNIEEFTNLFNELTNFGASAIKFDDHAKNLLQWLSLKRKERCHPPKRPLY